MGNLYFSYATFDRNAFSNLVNFSPQYLLLALTLAIMPWVGHTIRLYIWSRFLKNRIPLLELFRIAVATDLGAAVTPTMIGGAPIKLGMLVNNGFNAGAATTLIALATFEEICYFVVIIPVSLLITGDWGNPALASLATFFGYHWWKILLVIASLILLYRFFGELGRQWGVAWLQRFKLGHWLKRKSTKFKHDFQVVYRLIRSKGKIHFLASLLATIFQWLCRFGILVALSLALGFEDHLTELFLLQWMIFITMSFTPLPGGTGGAEVAFFFVFGSFFPEKLIAIVIAGWRFLSYYFVMVMAVVLLQLIQLKRLFR